MRNPLTSDLALQELVGRNHGLATMVSQGCMGLANAVGGLLMQQSLKLVWVVPLVASVGGVLGSLALRRHIPRHVAVSA